MKRRILSLTLALVLCFALGVTAFAAGEQLVLDEAYLLSESEAAALNTRLQQISSEYGAQIVVATVDSIDGWDIDGFINDVYDGMELGYGSTRDGVLLLVCMDIREYRILTNGMANDAIGAGGIDTISSAMVSDLSDGDYADAFNIFADECEYYLNGYLNGYPFDAGGTLLTALIIGIVVGIITALVLKGQLRTVRKQNQANVYVKPGSMHLTANHDFFLYREVSRTKKQTSSSSGSSGSSRSVGGGKF